MDEGDESKRSQPVQDSSSGLEESTFSRANGEVGLRRPPHASRFSLIYGMLSSTDRSPTAIFLFWFPLALQWIMMALEGPYLAAVIARLTEPSFNLAAYGVAYALAVLVESPVIMLMSASTALVEDRNSYRKLRNFAWALNVLSTLLLVVLLIPPVFDLVLRGVLGLPTDVADRVYGALWLLLPWPAAIGFRRFLHGLMIRAGQTRKVMMGTLVRLAATVVSGFVLARVGLPGAWVGAAALSTGVVVEAVVAWGMSHALVRQLKRIEAPLLTEDDLQGHHAPEEALDLRAILRFYYPLAMTSFIGLTIQPLLTFFMGRSPAPVESLALFPVVISIYFLFGSLGLSYQEAAIALVGRKAEYRKEIRNFALGLAAVASGGLGLIAFTPLASLWLEGPAGLSTELAELAIVPLRVIAVVPALTVLLGFQRALLVQARRTRPITVATLLEVVTLALLFPFLGWGWGWMGVTAAMAALACGRTVEVLFLAWERRATLRRQPQTPLPLRPGVVTP